MERYRFYNKVVAIGDKSKYLFTKDYISDKYKFEYQIEKLESKNIYVLYGDEDLVEDNVDEIKIYSKLFPKTKVMILPRDIFDLKLDGTDIEKLLIFNSFPYLKQTVLDDTESILNKFNTKQTESILYKEDRKFAESDLANEDDILRKAIETYKQRSIDTIIYKKGDLKDQIFNMTPNFIDSYKNDYKNRYNSSLEFFKRRYDSVYDSKINRYYGRIFSLLDPEEFEKFNEIFDFNSINKSQDIWMDFVKIFKKNYIENGTDERKSMLDVIAELYLGFIDDICFWDKEKNLRGLKECVLNTYMDHFGREKVLKAPDSELEYIKLMNESDENSLKIIFNNKLNEFLDHKLRNAIKQYIEKIYRQITIW